MERDDKGLGVLFGIKCGVNDNVGNRWNERVFGTIMEEREI